jgi:hypothetical protein
MQVAQHSAEIAAPDLGLGDSTFATNDHGSAFLVGLEYKSISLVGRATKQTNQAESTTDRGNIATG